MLKLDAYRELFPVTRNRVYFNHAAIAAPSVRVTTAMSAFLEDQAERGAAGYRDWMDRVARVRRQGAALLGAQPQELAFVPNSSSGLAMVAEAYPWQPGDAVLVPVPDFPANVYPWLHLARRGVRVIQVPRQQGGIGVEDFARALEPSCRMLVLSSVDYATGYAADLLAIGDFCRAHDLVFGVDAIQSLGVLPLDVKYCGVHFLAAGAHKWLLGPMGIGLLYVAEELLERLTPTLVGWKSVVNEEDFALHFKLRADAAGFEPGTLNLPGVYGLGAALELLQEVGVDRIRTQVLGLVSTLTEGLRQRGLTLHSPWSEREASGILTFASAGSAPACFRALSDAGVDLAVRDGRLRLSPHFYNNAEDVTRFLAALERLVSCSGGQGAGRSCR